MKRTISILLAVLTVALSMLCFTGCGMTKLFGKEVLSVGSQLDALNGLKKGDAQIAIIDSVMAGYYMKSEGFGDYTALDFSLATEEYGIGAKKGSDALMSKINEALIALATTDYQTIAANYGLSTELLVTGTTVNPLANATDGSWDDVKTAKKLIIGYTEFAPIAYFDGDGAGAKLIGFDIELATAVVDYLNDTYDTEIEVVFQKIDWNSKETLLANGTIHLVWNGMTITDERIEAMAMSIPYLANKQAVIVAKTDKATYESANFEEFKTKVANAVVIVEKGSAGEAQVLVED